MNSTKNDKPLYVLPLPGLLPCPTRSGNPHFTPQNAVRATPKRDQFPLAGSDTTMRPVRPLSAPENPSPAMDLSPSTRPYAPYFDAPQIQNLPQCDQTFVAVSDTIMRPMRPLPATKNFATATILAASATNTPPRPSFPQLRNFPQCGHPPQAGSDTIMRPLRPRPPHPSRPILFPQPLLGSETWSRK